MARKDILEKLESLRGEVRKKFKAEIKGIFGSYSRGEENENSDLDILVDFLAGATLLDLAGLGNFLEQELNCKVDVVSQRALRNEIKPSIYSDLIEL